MKPLRPKLQTPAAAPSSSTPSPRPRWPALSPGRALALPLLFTLALIAFALLTPVRQNPDLLRSFLGAGVVLLAWNAALYAAARASGRALTLDVAVHRHHWAQACAQVAVLLYWGWHVRLVYGFLPLILAQLIFAYAVDGLLTWTRRDRYTLGFGPFPVVLSINLFLWFRPEWFHWQFGMVLLGYLAKEFLRWNREGRSAHIFNPSSFPLAVASLGLILAGATEITFGNEIARSYSNPPYIYLWIFLVAVPGQLLFGVARMTMPAVVTLYAISLAYLGATGTYLFYDAHIPAPVFLGMHLLFTDPSTSPRSDLGRILFGVLYALAIAALFVILETAGVPSFYDKLLPVPVLNLLARRIDRLAVAGPLARWDPSRLGRDLPPVRRNVVYVSIWIVVFMGMSAAQGVGDRHPGRYLPFWETACAEGSVRACEYAFVRRYFYCVRGSGWACNGAGIHLAEIGRPPGALFQRGCELGFGPACENARRGADGAEAWVRAGPLPADLRILLRDTDARRVQDPARLYALACEEGWPGTCEVASGGTRP